MDLELFIHGVPAGQDFWGDDKEDQAYFQTMYDNSADETKFLIQVRALHGKLYCYYNYLIYSNVVGSSGRGGSYFGISLRFDSYCKDVLNVYRILDTAYNVWIVGPIISLDANKKKYLVSDFASASVSLTKIRDSVYGMVQKAFNDNSFLPLNDSFALKGENAPTSYLYDFTQEEILGMIKQYGKIVISPYCESKKEVSLFQQLATQNKIAQKEVETRLKADAESREKEKKETDDLKNKLSLKENEIRDLNAEVTRLKDELKIFGLKKELQEIIIPIKEPICQISTLLKQITLNSASFPKHTEKSGENELDKKREEKAILNTLNKVPGFLKSSFFCLGFVLICCLVYMGYTINNRLAESNQIADKDRNPVEFVEKANTQDVVDLIDENTNSEETIATDFDIHLVRIDVKKYNGIGPLNLGEVYTIEAINGAESGFWTVEGCDKDETENPKIIKIMPNDTIVKLVYHVDNQEESRKLSAK